MKLQTFVAPIWGALLSFSAAAQTQVGNADAIRKMLGTDSYSSYSQVRGLGAVKIAVLDNGFLGYAPGQDLLPISTTVVTGPVNGPALDSHGLGMAQILWSVTGRDPNGPEIYLINTNGFSNFKAAIDYIIQHDIRLVLYAQNWDFGGQFDGRGFINAEVNRALSHGVIWVNAAGNIGGMVYNGRVEINPDTGYLRLPGPYNTLRFSSKLDSNPVTVSLSWSDFTESETYNTNKDLDIFLYDSAGRPLPVNNYIQKGEARGKDVADSRSSYAREEFTLNLNRGDYTLKIQDRSRNFSASDYFRVTLSTPKVNSIDFLDATHGGEIAIPADNPGVFTVGDCSPISATGPTYDGRAKPDFLVRSSQVQFTDGNSTFGTSNAAAMITGALALMMAREPAFDVEDLRNYVSAQSTAPWTQRCGKTPIWRTPAPSELVQITR